MRLSLSLFAMACLSHRKNLLAQESFSRQEQMDWQSTGGEGAQVALLQSPILPTALHSKSKTTRFENAKNRALTNHIPVIRGQNLRKTR
jgi:hypothetical protein